MLAACSWDRRNVLALIAGSALLAACAAAGQPAGPWSRGAPMSTARSELTSAALDGRIYVAGGIAQLGASTDFAVYDPRADVWAELPPLPEDLHHLAAAQPAGASISPAATRTSRSGRSHRAPGSMIRAGASGRRRPTCRRRGRPMPWRRSTTGFTWSAASAHAPRSFGFTTLAPTVGMRPARRCRPRASISPRP